MYFYLGEMCLYSNWNFKNSNWILILYRMLFVLGILIGFLKYVGDLGKGGFDVSLYRLGTGVCWLVVVFNFRFDFSNY